MTALASAVAQPPEDDGHLRRLLLERALPVPSAEFLSLIAEVRDLALRKNDEREETVRSAILEWQGRQILSDKTFALDGVQVVTHEDVSYVVDFTFHAEYRQSISKVEPFNGQTVGGPLEDLWQRDASKKFHETATTWRRKGSGSRQHCGRCAHTGLVNCPDCEATGAIPKRCPECGGTGSIERADKFVGVEGGKGAGGVILRTEQCLRCNARGTISVHCGSCKGNGKVKCVDCAGTGDLFHYEELQLRVQLVRGKLTHACYPGLNPRWLKAAGTAATAEERIEEETDGQSAFAQANNGLNPRWAKYHIRTVPVTCARFVWRGKERELFFVDGTLRTSAPLPYMSSRGVMGVFGIVSVLALVLMWYFGTR